MTCGPNWGHGGIWVHEAAKNCVYGLTTRGVSVNMHDVYSNKCNIDSIGVA